MPAQKPDFKNIIANRIKKQVVNRFNGNSIYSDEYEIEAHYLNNEIDKIAIEVVYTMKSEPWNKKIKRMIYITIEEGM